MVWSRRLFSSDWVQPEMAGRADWPTRLVGLALAVLLVALQVWDPPLVEAARLRIFDQLQRWSPRPVPAPSPVAIIDIDDASLAELGQWPWPRTIFADLITTLERHGPKAIVFDVLFAEADRLSPATLAPLVEAIDARAAFVLRKLPSNEEAMASAMRESRVMLGEAGIGGSVSSASSFGVVPPARLAWLGADVRDALPSFPQGVAALPALAGSAKGLGLVTIMPEVDGVVRRAPSVARVRDRIIPSLSLEAVRVAFGESTLIVEGGPSGVTRVALREFAVPTDGDGRIWLHYTPRRPELHHSALDVLGGRVAREQLEGRIVLVGSSAASLGDVRVTPLAGNTPGVEVQAQLVESILTGDVLRRPGSLIGAETMLLLGAGLLLTWFGTRLPASLFPPLLGAVLLLAAGTVWYAFRRHGLLVDGAYPAFAITVLLFWLAMAKYIREETKRRTLRHAFGHYLSPVMVDRLAASPSSLALEGERRVLTVLFSDIRGFTALTESHTDSPERLTKLLNRYFTAMTEEILQEDGTIDKYIGDAIMAFWNAPLDEPRHQRRACLAALGMMRRLEPLNAELSAEYAGMELEFEPLRIGIGIGTGQCFVGNMGSEQRFNYSVIGDSVNVAARLEASSKQYGFAIIVGENVRACCQELAFLELDLVRLRGKRETSRIYALVGDEALAAQPLWPELATSHLALLAALRQDRAGEAEALVRRCQELADGLGIGASYTSFTAATARTLRPAA